MQKALLLASVVIGTVTTPAAQALSAFHLPSGRLACQYSLAGELGPQEPERLECEVQNPTYQVPPRPHADSPEQRGMPYADRLSLTAAEPAHWAFHGDTLLMPLPAYKDTLLPYGKSWSKGSFTCTSSTNGVRCSNRAGHGFELGRRGYKLF